MSSNEENDNDNVGLAWGLEGRSVGCVCVFMPVCVCISITSITQTTLIEKVLLAQCPLLGNLGPCWVTPPQFPPGSTQSFSSSLGTYSYILSGPQLKSPLRDLVAHILRVSTLSRAGSFSPSILEHRRCDKQEVLGLLRTTGREISLSASGSCHGPLGLSQPPAYLT